jgi:hypothetical protein
MLMVKLEMKRCHPAFSSIKTICGFTADRRTENFVVIINTAAMLVIKLPKP